MAQWVALFPYSKKVLRFESWLSQEFFCVDLACSPSVSMGFFQVHCFPPQSKSMQWIGYTILATVVSVNLSQHWGYFQFWVGSGRASSVKPNLRQVCFVLRA